MLKIAVCDDRTEDRDIAYGYAMEYCTKRQIRADIRSYSHPDALLSECEKFRPQIYILDIVMPMITGIQTAREIRWNQPDAQIIFATSEESYALESFDVGPLNYIVKPIKKEKLFETMDRAVHLVDLAGEKSCTIKVRGGYRTVECSEIMYIDYRNHVVTYHLLSKEEISTSTLRIGFAEYLSQNHGDSDIVQCHESVAVNIGAIDKLTRTEITVRSKEIIPVSKSRYASVADCYMNYRLQA